MDDLESRIRAAKPSTTGRYLPLTPRAEADLASILLEPVSRAPARVRRWLPIYAVVGTAIAAAIAVVLVFAAPRPTFAATPPGLQFQSIAMTTQEALAEMVAALNRSAVTPGPSQTIDVQMWSLNAIDGGALPTAVIPENVLIYRAADGARDVTVTAGPSYDRNGHLTLDGGSPAEGTVLRTEHQAAGEYPYQFPEAPPTTADGMRDYLEQYAGLPFGAGANDYLGAVPQVLMEWQLSSQQEISVLTLLEELPDLNVIGAVTDRLGRSGIAVEGDADGDYRNMLIISPETGQILSFETRYVGTERTDIPSPAVIAYYAWKRNQQ